MTNSLNFSNSMEPFDTIQLGRDFSMFQSEGPMSFLAMEHGQKKQFTEGPDVNGFWGVRETSDEDLDFVDPRTPFCDHRAGGTCRMCRV